MRLKGVPHFPQEKKNSCWHACARMLYGYKKKACTHPLPKKWAQDRGLNANEFIQLAKAVGLKPLPPINQSFNWTYLDAALKTYGPLWAAGYWNGYPHIIVITGVDAGGKVFVNDPAFPAPVERNIGWFNAKIASDENAPIYVEMPLMYLP